MKKLLYVLTGLFVFSLFSCASLQEDIFVSTGASSLVFESIGELEDSFIQIDCTYVTEQKVQTAEVSSLLAKIDTSDNHMEPVVKARLLALQGLMYLYQGKTSKANDSYIKAKGSQAGDPYVLILGSRLEKTKEAQLARLNTILKIEQDDGIINLEKAKVLYSMHNYNEALASVDKAFLIFNRYGQENYRTGYAPLKDKIWEMHKLSMNSDSSISSGELLKPVTPQTMVSYTTENTNLLNFYTAGTKYKTTDLLKKLENAGYLSSALDPDNLNKTSVEITKAKYINRKMAARFLWNVYIQNSGKQNQLTKYSSHYAKSPTSKSPVLDVELNDQDLDAVLGCIENEIMELPDGKNFFPEENITTADFLACLKAAE